MRLQVQSVMYPPAIFGPDPECSKITEASESPRFGSQVLTT